MDEPVAKPKGVPILVAITPDEIEMVEIPGQEHIDKADRTLLHLKPMKFSETRGLSKFMAAASAYSNQIVAAQAGKKSFMEVIVDPEFVDATVGVRGKPKGLVGWTNFKDKHGNEIEFDEKTYLDQMHTSLIFFAAMRIFNMNMLGTEKKNLSTGGIGSDGVK